LIALPISYLITKKWLDSFAYKTQLNWWIFILAGCTAMLIAIVTISWQSYRVARMNPVETMRYE
jgi:putative ABC transport system permease protein